MNILEQLYNGKVFPCETIIPQNHSEYRAVSGKAADDFEYFMKALPAEQARRFEEMEKRNTELTGMQSYANFEYGFKLGAMIMCEIFSNYQEPKE